VPEPITWFGWLVSTARAAAGIGACPAGLPARNAGLGVGVGDGVGLAVGDGDAETLGIVATCGEPETNWLRGADEHADSAVTTSSPAVTSTALPTSLAGSGETMRVARGVGRTSRL